MCRNVGFPGESSTEPCNQACPKKKKRKIEDIEDVMLRNLTNLEKKSAQKEDEDELFGKQIVATLRRLTYRQKAHAKMRIQGVLLDIEFPAEELTQQHSNCS